MNAHKFNFFGFEPNAELEQAAELAIERLIDHAPYGAYPIASLTRSVSASGVEYRCALEIHTRYGPFIARAQRSDAISALLSVEHAMRAKLRRWNKARLEAMDAAGARGTSFRPRLPQSA